MRGRAEPFLAERLWAHPSQLAASEGDPVTELDDAGRPSITRYADGGEERYPRGVVWERCHEPWSDLLRRGAASLAERCHAALANAGADQPEVYCLMLTYVSDGGLDVLVSAGTEADRRTYLARDESPEIVAANLWYPESDNLSFLDVEPDPALDPLLLREAALNDPREPQRTVLSEAAKLMARRAWYPILRPTEDFVVYIAEHDEGLTEKHASVREVNPADRVARWDASWPASLPRD